MEETKKGMEETKNGLTRRNFLGSTAVGALGLATITAGSLINPREAQAALLTFPQPTVLDVNKIRDLGYYWYKKGPGCGHGAGRALIQGFSEACVAQGIEPAGWNDVPRNLYAWCNSGGPGAFGALCGAIAGAVGVMNLIGKQGDIGRAVFEWYVKQPFPADMDNFNTTLNVESFGTAPAPIPHAEVRANVAADSPLCHVSVSKWMAAAGVYHGEVDSLGRDIRSDRCAKVTAETAAYTAFLYNEFKAGRNPAGWVKPAAMASCYDCHDTNGTTVAASPPLSNRSTQTKMDCLPCHTEPKSGRK